MTLLPLVIPPYSRLGPKTSNYGGSLAEADSDDNSRFDREQDTDKRSLGGKAKGRRATWRESLANGVSARRLRDGN